LVCLSFSSTSYATDWGLIAKNIAMDASVVYDIETTYRALGSGAREGNPSMDFFLKKGRKVSYPVFFGVNYLISSLRKDSWLAPGIIIGTHTGIGTLNLRF
jgi:hypothetical protein